MFCPLALKRIKNKKGFRMELGLKNKSVIVTAASGGLGLGGFPQPKKIIFRKTKPKIGQTDLGRFTNLYI